MKNLTVERQGTGLEEEETGYFNNIIKELRLEDRFGFRDMFRLDIVDFEYILGQISDLISPKEIIGGTDPILAIWDMIWYEATPPCIV